VAAVVRTYGGREVALTNLDKVLFPEDGLTKGDVIDGVVALADGLLPALRDRPLSMERFPDGIGQPGFFHKHLPKHFPDWVRTVEVPTSRGPTRHVVVDDVATLALVTNFGCLVLHVPTARADRPDHPDQLVVDLDPSVDDLAALRVAGHRVRALLAERGMPSFPRWSGSRGLHVVVPLDRAAPAEVVGARSVLVAEALAGRHPEMFTTAFKKADRGDRIYVDVGRNFPSATVVASWSLRARPGAPVAMPIAWEELDATSPRQFTLRTAPERLAVDAWAGFDAARVDAGRLG
jgi:bifunctional non-homologous end joining protein LigD